MLAATLGLALSFTAKPANTWALSNGDFETGDFTSWETTGITSIETAAFLSGPTEGTFQALLQTGDKELNATSDSDLETFLGLSSGALDSLVITDSSRGAVNGSAIKQTKSASAGDILSIDFNYLTREGSNLENFNDTAFVRISGPGVDLLETLADTFSGLSFSPTVFIRETGFQTFSFTFPETGSYLVGLGTVNVGDDEVNSGLLVDNGSQTPIPEPVTVLLLGSGLAGLVVWRMRKAKV